MLQFAGLVQTALLLLGDAVRRALGTNLAKVSTSQTQLAEAAGGRAMGAQKLHR